MAKRRTQVFGWKEGFTHDLHLARSGKLNLDESARLFDKVKENHRANVVHLQSVLRGGTRPLSRFHPSHPCWEGRNLDAVREFVPANQKFAR